MAELAREHVRDPLARVHIDGVERFIHEYPAGRVQQQARKGNCLLLVFVELVIPTM